MLHVYVCSRPDSADGFLSPSLSSSRNGEKDWENGSTTSSVTSNTEYTGWSTFLYGHANTSAGSL